MEELNNTAMQPININDDYDDEKHGGIRQRSQRKQQQNKIDGVTVVHMLARDLTCC